MALTGLFGSSDSLWASMLVGEGFELSGDIEDVVSNEFAWTQTLTSPTYRLAADRLFFFGALAPDGQEATHNYFFEDVSNTFDFDSFTGYDYFEALHQYLGFSERYFTGAFGNFMGLTDSVRRAYVASATNTFNWNDEDSDALLRAYNAENTFVFTQTITSAFVYDFYDPIGFDDIVDSSETEYIRPATHQIIKQHLTYKIQGAACPEKEYAPHVGSSDDATYPAVSVNPPTLGTGTFTLTYPLVSPTSTLVLKSPEFGNTDTLTFTVIDRKTRGGDRKIFTDLDWGKRQSFELTVVNICEPEIDDIIDFLNISLGKEIGLADWEGRDWQGVIIAPESEVAPQIGGFRVRIVFEGVLQ